jgi:uncharacterized protein
MDCNCCQYFVVEYNGDIFPCDFFVDRDLRIGNVADTSWEEAQQSPVYRAFGQQKSVWSSACEKCGYLSYCSGDCLKHRLPRENDPATLSWLCSGWKSFYEHTLSGFKKLAKQVQRERAIASEVARRRVKLTPDLNVIGRNDPCPCGSGKKLKRCHGKS